MSKHKIISNLVQDETTKQKLKAEFDELAKELANKEVELATLQNELSVFERKYASIIGVLLLELDEIEKDIAQEILQLNPNEKNRRNFQKAEQKSETTRETVKEKLQQTQKKDFSPSEEFKELFHRVAKTVHPDFGTSESDRAFRNKLMARANAAYQCGDKTELEKILGEWKNYDIDSELPEYQADEINQLEKKIAQIRIRLAEIHATLLELKKSELYQLMVKTSQAIRQGQDLLKEIENAVKHQIEVAKIRRYALKQQKRPKTL